MSIPLRLLLIEDSVEDAELVIWELTRAGYDVTSSRVDTSDALVAALHRERWDLAVADFTMPRFSGPAALAILRLYDPDVPFIFVSGTIGEDAAVAAMKSGAQDYIMKGHLKRLAPAVDRELREAGVRGSRKRAEERLAHMAYHDPLTDLPNRALMYDRLQQAILSAERAGGYLTLMVLDLDGFKAINDSLGHLAGDRVLQEIASRLRGALHEADTVARLGGDEFALLLPQSDRDQAVVAAQTILKRLNEPLLLDGRLLSVAGSIGIAEFPEHGATAEALLQKADIAMYAAKSSGLGLAVYAADRDRPAHGRLAAIAELREAVEHDQFACYYQPIVNLRTGAVTGVETLARWQHPQRGLLPPSEFIELAEQTGLIELLTMLLLDRALGEWAADDAGLVISIAVNLSARNLRDPELPSRVAEMLRRHGVPPSRLVLEITESFIMSELVHSLACLSRLSDMGVSLAIDDFGTGYSSLSYLRQLPVDQLKIDRSFVTGLTTGDTVILRSTIDLAHNLGLSVVAEGVESAVVQDCLRDLGCDAAQGLFIARPAPAAEIRRWAAGRGTSSI